MSRLLRLTITTPDAVLVERDDIGAVRAEDESGGFGILPGHADLLTVLPSSVVRWRDGAGATGFCALRSAVLTVNDGRRVAIACRQGKVGNDLETLEGEVRAMRADETEAERRERVEHMRAHARAVRQMMRYLRPGGTDGAAMLRGGSDEP